MQPVYGIQIYRIGSARADGPAGVGERVSGERGGESAPISVSPFSPSRRIPKRLVLTGIA